MGRLENKTAVVTGGGSGIGRAIARRFAEEGARVIIAGRTEATLKETAAADGKEGLKCLRSPRALRELIPRVLRVRNVRASTSRARLAHTGAHEPRAARIPGASDKTKDAPCGASCSFNGKPASEGR